MSTHYPGTEQERLALDVYIKLYRAADSVSQRINRHLADASLTVSQFGVLEALYHLGPLCQSELAQKILKSSGNLTLVVDNLEKRGLVVRQRDNVDRRYVTVNLTEAGRVLISELFPSHVGIVVREIGVLSEEEQRQLGQLCRKLGLAQEAWEAEPAAL